MKTEAKDGAWLWPTLVVAGLLLVVIVNAAFIWIAVEGADPVVESYFEEVR
ncbi:MAG: FixH family protein [Longimicrobiales bacterium]|nr:FixH family protein [Longimicrobiales bacterium]